MNSQERKPLDIKSILLFVILVAGVLILPKALEFLGVVEPEPERPVTQETARPVSPAETIVPDTTPVATEPPPDTSAPKPQTTPSAAGFAVDSSTAVTGVRVETERYSVLLTTQGARLRRLVLKDYSYTGPERRGEPIVFVDTNEYAGPRFSFFNDRLDWSAVPFDVDRTEYSVTGSDSVQIDFTTYTAAGNELTITYTFYGDRHHFGYNVSLPEPWREGLEREYYFGWEGGLWPTEPDPKSDNNSFAAVGLMGEDLEKIDDVDEDNPVTRLSGLTHWAAVRTKYFVTATIPRSREADGLIVKTRQRPFRDDGELISLKQFSALVRVPLPAGSPLNERFTVYAGPVEYGILKSYGIGLEDLVELGWRWLVRPFALLILWLFKALHKVIPNYGLVIIVFSLLIKAVFHPLTKKSMRSMRRMQTLQPHMEKLKERFKDDPQRLNQEMMKLYKQQGINPISGCLPLLPQMPIFYGLFQVFRTTIELRGAHFVWWLTDLSQKDPYYILPIIMTVSFFVQQRLSSKDPKQKALTYVLPLVFGFMFKDFPAGLTLYWTMYNIFSVIEQAWLIGHPDPVEAGTGEVGSGKISKTKRSKR